MGPKSKNKLKKPYTKPRLVVRGNIDKITLVNGCNPLGNPGGHCGS
jgi:hypothetical protein